MREEEEEEKGVGDIRAEPLIPPKYLWGARMEALVDIQWRVGASERVGHQDLHFLSENLGHFWKKGKVF